jgi:FAD/FMN-containing dehydrogenases
MAEGHVEWSRRSALKGFAGAAGTIPLLGYSAAAGPLTKGGTPPGGGAGDAKLRGANCPQAKLTGRIVRPNDPGYASASLGWDELFVHYPLVIVYAQETQDVVNALTWAGHNDVALRVRSGGHSLEGWSNVDNGIVIDVSELKGAHIDTASLTATVGAGLNQGEAVAALAAKDLAVTTGTEGSVGLSGATLGGGLGFLTRYIGMACDNLIGAEIVVASGADCAKVINVDQRNHSDLLWALRGAGNGNFGIVTSLTYKVTPVKKVAYLKATWEGLKDLQGVFAAWQRTAPFADNRLGTQLEIHKPEIMLFGGSRGRDGGRGEGAAGPDPVGWQPHCHGAGRGLGRHLCRIPDSDREGARELEVLLAVHHRAVPEEGNRPDPRIHGGCPFG